ncbi:hypothetical protein [Niallia sp. 01092]
MEKLIKQGTYFIRKGTAAMQTTQYVTEIIKELSRTADLLANEE